MEQNTIIIIVVVIVVICLCIGISYSYSLFGLNPKDCKYTWSDWSTCDQTNGKQSRTINIISDKKGNGSACPSEQKEERYCLLDETLNYITNITSIDSTVKLELMNRLISKLPTEIKKYFNCNNVNRFTSNKFTGTLLTLIYIYYLDNPNNNITDYKKYEFANLVLLLERLMSNTINNNIKFNNTTKLLTLTNSPQDISIDTFVKKMTDDSINVVNDLRKSSLYLPYKNALFNNSALFLCNPDCCNMIN